MAEPLHGGHHAEVERVAGVIGERADAAFAEHYLVVAFAHDVFGGHQEFVECGATCRVSAARAFAGASGALEQRKILHVAGADLDDVGVFFDQIEGFVVDGFGDDAQAVLFANLGQNLQAVIAEALKAVRRSARLVGAAAEEAARRWV